MNPCSYGYIKKLGLETTESVSLQQPGKNAAGQIEASRRSTIVCLSEDCIAAEPTTQGVRGFHSIYLLCASIKIEPEKE